MQRGATVGGVCLVWVAVGGRPRTAARRGTGVPVGLRAWPRWWSPPRGSLGQSAIIARCCHLMPTNPTEEQSDINCPSACIINIYLCIDV